MTIQLGIPVARIELMNALQVKACNAYSGLALPEAPLLFLDRRLARLGEAASEAFGEVARYMAPAASSGRPIRKTAGARSGKRATTSIGRPRRFGPARTPSPPMSRAPISRLAECVTATEEDIAAHGLVAPIVGHAGDGNFHVSMVIDDKDPGEIAGSRSLRRAARCLRARHGRHLHGRARHRPGQAGIPGRARRLGRHHAPDQASTRDIFNPGKIFALD